VEVDFRKYKIYICRINPASNWALTNPYEIYAKKQLQDIFQCLAIISAH